MPILRAVGRGQRLAAGRRADRAVEPRRAEPVEEARRHALALQHAHRAGVAVGHDRLGVAPSARRWRAGARRCRPAPRPRSVRSKRPLPLAPDALQRMQHALGVVGALGVARDLGAQRAVRRRMGRIALHLHGPAVLHRDQHRAGVGAVVRAGGANELRCHGETMAQRGGPRRPPGAPFPPRGDMRRTVCARWARRVNWSVRRSSPCKSSNPFSPTRRRSRRCAATSMPTPSCASRKSAPRT